MDVWKRLSADRPEMREDNLSRALHNGYFGAGRFWLACATPPCFVAAILWSSSIWIPATIVSIIGCTLVGVALLRAVQALRFWPHLMPLKMRPTRNDETD